MVEDMETPGSTGTPMHRHHLGNATDAGLEIDDVAAGPRTDRKKEILELHPSLTPRQVEGLRDHLVLKFVTHDALPFDEQTCRALDAYALYPEQVTILHEEWILHRDRFPVPRYVHFKAHVISNNCSHYSRFR
jgi:hypothetical protein